MLPSLESLGQAWVSMICPVLLSRKIARRRNGWFGSELSRLERAGRASPLITNVATITSLFRKNKEVLDRASRSRLRPTTSPRGWLPIAGRRSVFDFAVRDPVLPSGSGVLGLVGKCPNKNIAA